MRRPPKRTLRAIGLVWAAPWTALGMCVGTLGLLTGGRARLGRGVLEFHGGAVRWLLRFTLGDALAMTLGHVVLGQSPAALDFCEEHELVHVRQYERWGPFFVPAYLTCSLVLWLTGKRAYYDNPFEREAYGKAP